MSWKAACALGAVLAGFGPATTAWADDQQLVTDYLASRNLSGAVVRPIADDFVGRTFPNYSFFGVIFRQFPVAVLCPPAPDLKCANVFFVKDGAVDFVSNVEDLKFFFAAQMGAAGSGDAATDAANTWLRLSEELKQDLFYTFGAADVSYEARDDVAVLRGHAGVSAGGDGGIDMVMTLSGAGSFLSVYEKSALRAGVRPVCQATKLLDPDPIVRRMAEQDLLVMGRAAKGYMDAVRATAPADLREAIDRMWKRILIEGR